jgi:glycine cleavage system H lipoate-binding protein
MFIPISLHYTKNHLWLMRIGSDHFFVGITDFAQKQ